MDVPAFLRAVVGGFERVDAAQNPILVLRDELAHPLAEVPKVGLADALLVRNRQGNQNRMRERSKEGFNPRSAPPWSDGPQRGHKRWLQPTGTATGA